MSAFAVLGGTFDPVHWGHLRMANIAWQQFALDRILWLPTYRPVYKASAPILGFEHRVEMVQRAIAPYPQFTLSTIERTQPHPIYAIDTLLALQSLYPDRSWYWIIGLDAFQSLPRWHRHQELAPQCQWLVAPRCPSSNVSQPSQEAQPLTNLKEYRDRDCLLSCCQQVATTLAQEAIKLNWHLLNMPHLAISSSLIRQRRRNRQSICNLVPEPVCRYIYEHRFYES
jgi:nicotinate-nucleotide adenylyltransferase